MPQVKQWPSLDLDAASFVESQRSVTMPSGFWRLCWLLLLLPTLAAVAANTPNSELPRFLVYFDEFSANLSDEAKTVIADAAKRARDSGAKAIVVQARASSTGKPEPN